jgi:hypothetical protein
MFLQCLDRWRRRLDLDRACPKEGHLEEHVCRAIHRAVSGRFREGADKLLQLSLLRGFVDRAVAVHFFFDTEDGCLREQECLAVAEDCKYNVDTPSARPSEEWDDSRPPVATDARVPDPSNPAYERVWYECVPLPPQIVPDFFRLLRSRAGLRGTATEGELLLRYRGKDLTVPVVARYADDVRIYFGPERPPIRPKLARQFAELGLPPG